MHHIHRYLAALWLLLPLWAGAQVNRDACPGDPPTWCYVEGLPGSTFEWWAPNAEILQRDNNRILVRWPGPGHYVLKVIETSPEGCTGDTVWANVLVRPAGDGDCVPTLDVPNIFTPNGDTQNDLFAVRGTHLVVYQMQIFNR